MNYGSLASTGAGLVIGGVVVDQIWLVVAGFAFVAVGALVIRFGFRRNMGADQ